MPQPDEFLTGYGLTQGIVHADWKITTSHADHIQVKRWWIYEYPVTITFTYIGTKTPNTDTLISWFPKYIQQDRIMYTDAGNAWLCSLQVTNITRTATTVTFTCHGIGERISKEPKGHRDPDKRYAIDYPQAADLMAQYYHNNGYTYL
jgi:hypothetical protein